MDSAMRVLSGVDRIERKLEELLDGRSLEQILTTTVYKSAPQKLSAIAPGLRAEIRRLVESSHRVLGTGIGRKAAQRVVGRRPRENKTEFARRVIRTANGDAVYQSLLDFGVCEADAADVYHCVWNSIGVTWAHHCFQTGKNVDELINGAATMLSHMAVRGNSAAVYFLRRCGASPTLKIGGRPSPLELMVHQCKCKCTPFQALECPHSRAKAVLLADNDMPPVHSLPVHPYNGSAPLAL